MDISKSPYSDFHLCAEMCETPGIVRNFDPAGVSPFAAAMRGASRILLTGEGSSRIFPARHALYRNARAGWPVAACTEGATQALEYPLADAAVLGASNSGKTKELVRLFRAQKALGHRRLFGLTASAGSVLAEESALCHVLSCGPERAVAATKSVVEQALFEYALFRELSGKPLGRQELALAADGVAGALAAPLPPAAILAIGKAVEGGGTFWFAGRDDGVAEELALKANEIVRRKGIFMEGTYAVHGVEEVMRPQDLVVLVEPFADEDEKFEACLARGVGAGVVALASRETRFPTVLLPGAGELSSFVALAAGWSLLVEAGLRAGVALDTPVRARKVGNEVSPSR